MHSSDSSTNAKIEAVQRSIAVAWCAIFIVTPSIWYTILAAKLIHKALISADDRAFGNAIPSLLLVLGIELFYGVAFARFLLRLVPSEPGKGDGLRHVLRLLLLGCSLSPLVVLFYVFNSLAQIALAISSTLWLAFVLAPLVSVNRRLKRLSPGRFILFLRRFSTFSERAILGLVLSLVPPDKPLVLLTPNRSRPSDWNPFLISFAGLKLSRPLGNLPVVLRAPDADWERPAKSLIADAHQIVLDISAGSGAIQTEMMMIQQASRWHETICVKDGSTGNPELDNFILAKDGWLVAYKKSWSQVVPRLLLFIVLSAFSLLWLASTITETSHPSSEFEKQLAAFEALILWVVPFLSGLGLLVYSTFIYPSITFSVKPAIRRALRGVPSDNKLIHIFEQHHQKFERLIKMSQEDFNHDAAISLRVITRELTSNKDQLMLSSERRDQYGELFQSLRLGHGMRLQSKDFIVLACHNNIVGRSGCEKGYVYTTTSPLKPLCDSLDIQSARGRYLYRELKPNWYLYLFEK
jgi:hypothetical protein